LSRRDMSVPAAGQFIAWHGDNVILGILAGWRGVRHFFRQGYVYIWANLLWIVLTVLIIPAPMAWAGICRLSYNAYRQPTAQFGDFWDGFKAHWRGGLVISLVGTLLVIINLVNLIGARNETSLVASVLRVLWLMILTGWFGIQLYAFPLLNAMVTPNLRGAYRNAGVMFVRNPFYSLGLLVVCLPVIIISLIFPAAWFLISGGLFAAIANSAVLDRLVEAGIQSAPAENREVDVTAWEEGI